MLAFPLTRAASTLPRRLVLGLAAASLALAAGCASLGNQTISSEVSSYGEWPAGRSLGTYQFERLPSQEARAQEQAELESAARTAIERAGFRPAAPSAQADVLVQVGARSTRLDRSTWDDRWWPRVSVWGGRGIYWGLQAPIATASRIDREVAVLLRDRASGKTLYETRANNTGFTGTDMALLAAMFDAAMKDFPRPAVSPRRVDTPLQPAAAAMPTAGTAPASPPVTPPAGPPVVR